MNTDQAMENRLWDYIDGRCSPAETTAIESLLASDPVWKNKYQSLINLHELLHQSELEAPSMRFTKNVMEAIGRSHVAPATKTYINKNIIRGIGAFLLTILAALFVFFLKQMSWSSGNPTPANNITLPNLGLDTLPYGKIFNGAYASAFVLIATVSGLVLLDIYLQRKRKASRPISS